MELHVYLDEFYGGGDFNQECSTYPEVAGVKSGWESQES